MPPENRNADITDEDSGDENQVNLNNLPGSQSQQGEVCFGSERDSSDYEDVPLIQLSKRRRVESEDLWLKIDELRVRGFKPLEMCVKIVWQNASCLQTRHYRSPLEEHSNISQPEINKYSSLQVACYHSCI